MTTAQLQEAKRKLDNMKLWLITQKQTENYDDKARAVLKYEKLLERAVNVFKKRAAI